MRDYLVACGDTIEKLRNEVMLLVNNGYAPQGGIAIDRVTIENERKGYVEQETTYYQAMYRGTIG